MQEFGGEWTREKISRVVAYLRAYNIALQPHGFRRIYFDAFAGTGSVQIRRSSKSTEEMQQELELLEALDDAPAVIRGSALAALDLPVPFDKYVFVELRRSNLQELRDKVAKHQYADRVEYRVGDANEEIQQFCRRMRDRDRGVIFLDPFGMSVEWATLKTIADTQKLDVWLLFASGTGANRMLTRSGEIPQSWREVLNRTFGDSEWESDFYQPSQTIDLFSDEPKKEKVSRVADIDRKFLNRLTTIFPYVDMNPLPLLNKNRSHLFSLMFCCSNPDERAIALSKRVARHVLDPRRAL